MPKIKITTAITICGRPHITNNRSDLKSLVKNATSSLLVIEIASGQSLVAELEKSLKIALREQFNFCFDESNFDLEISYFDESAEHDVMITVDDDVAMFWDQFEDLNVHDDHKLLHVNVLLRSSSDSRFPGFSFDGDILITQNDFENEYNIPTFKLSSSTQSENERMSEFLNNSYHSVEFLAEGGFGKVYKAVRKNSSEVLNGERAIKLMKSDDWKMGNDALQEFQKTIQLEHEYIVKTFKCFFVGDISTIGIEMELMKGSLFDLIIVKKQVLSETLILRIISQIGQALNYIKTKFNLVHRDIKPHNILIRKLDIENEEIEIGLGDFGLARKMESVNKTRMGGSLNYFSPEILESLNSHHDLPFSFSSDIFALGVTLYQLITFDSITNLSTLMLHSTNQDSLQEFVMKNVKSSYSSFLIDLILSMTRMNPSKRITVTELVQKLNDHEQELEIQKYKMNSEKLQTLNETLTKLLTLEIIMEQPSLQPFEDEHVEQSNEYLKNKDFSKAFELYERAANEGKAYGQHGLGHLFENGFGVEQNYSKAFEFYEKAAHQGHVKSQVSLGVLYRDGKGVKKDYLQALELFIQAAATGNTEAQRCIGFMYRDGLGVERNDVQAFQWCQRSAIQGNAMAQCYVGYFLANGKGVDKDDEKAIEWYQLSVQQGNEIAQNNLGYMYKYGRGVEQDYKKAFEWYQQSAKQGYALAIGNLAYMYYRGEGVEQDYKKAFELYQQAAEQQQEGNSNAQAYVGLLYEKGYGVEKDYEKAREWYEKSAAQNDKSGLLFLADLYYSGRGVEQNFVKAFELFEKAGKFGHSCAWHYLGRMYELGLAVKKDLSKALEYYEKSGACCGQGQFELGCYYYENFQDYAKAFEWFDKSAKNNTGIAMEMLGKMYLAGQGVEQNYEKAFELFQKAAHLETVSSYKELALMYKQGKGVEKDESKAMEWFVKANKKRK